MDQGKQREFYSTGGQEKPEVHSAQRMQNNRVFLINRLAGAEQPRDDFHHFYTKDELICV